MPLGLSRLSCVACCGDTLHRWSDLAVRCVHCGAAYGSAGLAPRLSDLGYSGSIRRRKNPRVVRWASR